jgi:hypothetical protein
MINPPRIQITASFFGVQVDRFFATSTIGSVPISIDGCLDDSGEVVSIPFDQRVRRDYSGARRRRFNK